MDLRRKSPREILLILCVCVWGCAQATLDEKVVRDATVADHDDGAAKPDGTPLNRCSTNNDCIASPAGPVCDTVTGQCAQCTPAQDTCPPGQVCDPMNNMCRVGCSNDMDCGAMPGARVRCDLTTRRCVGCVNDEDCALGTLCRMGTCVPGCTETHACGVGATCCNGQCHDLQTDTMHCGACGAACTRGSACCAGTCQRVDNDTNHCGRCGNVCSIPRGSPVCTEGNCAVGTCDTGYGDCDRMASNGCEVDLQSDAMHCGACGHACPSGPNAMGRCVMGTCRTECAAGFGDCDGDASNGCETSLTSTPAHCGMCGRACPSGPASTATCAMSVCGLQCAPGAGDCDMAPSNGCETSLTTSTMHCGACGVACAFTNGNAACIEGRCALASCRTGFDNCDGDGANGCETPVSSDNNNCGRCGNRCPPGTACSMGTCSSICGGGTTFCGDRCVTLETNPQHCGTCGRVCPGGANGTPACRGGVCGLTCNPGFGDCDGSPVTGCETNLRAAVEHCGACGRSCRIANATAVCSDASCRIGACNVGFANCNGVEADGCETNIAADVMNCGTCGRACSLPNAGSSCSGGVCRIGACTPGFANCNGSESDGCEVNLGNNNFNCGSCGTSCPPGTACSGGTCGSICTGGTTFCSGTCVSTATDPRNCGACGNICAAGQSCVGGVCRAPGPPNDTCAGAQTISLASTNQILSATTVGAVNNLTSPCGFAGADVWFRFTLSQRELVYADTVGASYDTILYLASGCSTPLTGTPPAGMAYCNDDMGSVGCTSGGLQSQITALLNPGTYYLVLAGYGSATGPANIRFQHLPVGNGAVTLTNPGSNTYSGATSGSSGIPQACGGGSGPEVAYWWKTCPGGPSGTVTATTCSRASWDTVLALRNGDGVGDTCNDDSCGLQSTISGTISATPGLHVLFVDGYNGASGSFSVLLTRP